MLSQFLPLLPPAPLLCVPDHQTEQEGPRGGFSVVSRRLARHTDYPRIQSTTTSTSRLFSSLDESDSGDLSDQEEWKALVASLKMYKAAYGKLKVPSRFVVPAMAPWPSEFF